MERPELSRGSRAERHTTRASQRRLASRRLASAARRSMDGWLAAPSTDSAHVASILTRVRRRLSSYTSLESYICRKLESAARCFTHPAKLTQHSRGQNRAAALTILAPSTIHSAPPTPHSLKVPRRTASRDCAQACRRTKSRWRSRSWSRLWHCRKQPQCPTRQLSSSVRGERSSPSALVNLTFFLRQQSWLQRMQLSMQVPDFKRPNRCRTSLLSFAPR